MLKALPRSYDSTRRDLHAVAEHVLAAALHAETGRIGLRASAGGFATPPIRAGSAERELRVEGIDLVVVDGRAERRAPLRTIAAAAELVGIEPGGPSDVYELSTPLEPDRPLELDSSAAAILHGWFALTSSALEVFCRSRASDGPSVAQLWPEHFDLAVTINQVNYGGSPGDQEHAGPYIYVGPWAQERGPDEFWNEPFGASAGWDQVTSPESALEFFERGRLLAP